jgi:Tol biopolymer transport system component
MALTPGMKLGPYEIVSQLGAGGMGEVYRARDTRLERIIAIKVLPESLANDAERLQRFEQEARVLSTVSHPNLLAIYDVGTQDGLHYLVSEFLEGQTLRERVGGGVLPQRKVSEYALQIANGLAAAHDKGIVHRDLKPENIFVTRDEHVKILDFGLAKQSEGVAGVAGESVTISTPGATTPGTVMGTVGYMSPEQVRGQAVDNRSDIFTFGAILYEMVAGRRAFKGESGVETMNAILKEDPPEIDIAQMKVSPGMERIVRHCLEKNPTNRFQSARDLGFALGALSGSDATATVRAVTAAETTAKSAGWMKRAAVAAAVLASAAAGYFLRPRGATPERLEFTIPLQEETSNFAISADGRVLALVSPDPASGTPVLSVERVGSSALTILQGTEGASYPFWSPDDSFVGFFADGKMKKVAASGGISQVIATASAGRGGSWGKRGLIIYAPQAAGWLWSVNADGSNAAPLTQNIYNHSTDASHRWPVFLPDGNHFLFYAGNFTTSPNDHSSGIYLSSLAGKERKLVYLAPSNPGYASGYLYFTDSERRLDAIAFDPSQGTTSGEQRIVAEKVGFQPSVYWGAFSVAETGTVVYSPTVGASLSMLTWYDRAGKELGHVGDAAVISNPSLSPDNQKAVMDIADAKANNVNIWLSDLQRGTSSRFTFDTTEDSAAAWSRDGSTIAYRSSLSDTQIFVKASQGLQAPRKIFEVSPDHSNDDMIPNVWSPDGKQILCVKQPGEGGSELDLVPVAGGNSIPFLKASNEVTAAQISPDGKWVAYASQESGDWEIYVTTFPSAAGKWQVSRGGGTEPRWRGDGKEIFYIGPKSMLTAVAISGSDTFSAGNVTPLFRAQLRAPVSSTDMFAYDVTKDGQRFLVDRYAKPAEISPLRIVLNATAGSLQ